jgi:hypothetical protein
VPVDGLKQLTQQIQLRIQQAKKAGVKAAVAVGYTQYYAIYVHENLTANHPNGGQAKYLEIPFRQLSAQAAQFLTDAMSKGVSLPDALMLLGLQLQRESQQLVPVDTGALRASAFTRLEKL